MESKSQERKNKIDLIIKIVLIIIIILLLIHNCALIRERGKYNNNVPNGNVDIIEITCDSDQCKPVVTPSNDKPSSPTPTSKSNKVIKSLSFDNKNISIQKGSSLQLIVKVNPTSLSSQKLIWSSDDSGVVTVDENGVITGIRNGVATITVTSSNGKTATCVVTVVSEKVPVDKITLSPSKLEIDVNEESQISAVIKPDNATDRELVWSSSDSSVVTVNNKGIVKGIKPGKVTITAKTKDGKVVSTMEVTVKAPKQIESLNFNADNVSVKKGKTLQLMVEVTPTELSNEKLTWTSSDPSVVSVDSNGVVKGLKEGTATITVTSSNGKTATCVVTVTTDTIPVESITLNPEDMDLVIGDTAQISATVNPSNATDRDIVWTSSNNNIATVNNNGVVTGVSEGTVTITAKTKDGKVVATCTVEVKSGELEVFDDDKPALEWNGSTNLSIFSKSIYNVDGKLAPESENTYEFVVRNSTKYDISYDVSFDETNLYHINMKYKLKKNNTYVIDHYVTFEELKLTDQVLSSGSKDVYHLEWKWISSSNDMSIGTNPDANYGLKIEVEAESVE